MSRATNILAGAALVALGFAGSATAATITLTPVVTSYWADAGNVGGPSDPIPANNAAAGAYRVDIKVQATPDATDQTAGNNGFGNVAFDVNLPAGGHLSDLAGWNAIIPSVRTAGDGSRYTDPITNAVVTAGSTSNLQRAALWTDNGDIGASTTDLKFIYVDVGQLTAFNTGDPRATVATPAQNSNVTTTNGLPMTLGSLILQYDGTGTQNLGLSFGTGEGYSMHNNTTTLHGPVSTAGATLGTVSFGGSVGTTPEPGTLALLAFAAIPAMRRRRA
jgi:MYXO-CTERM domain-containing protein